MNARIEQTRAERKKQQNYFISRKRHSEKVEQTKYKLRNRKA